MYCNTCQKTLSADENRCSICGTPAAETPQAPLQDALASNMPDMQKQQGTNSQALASETPVVVDQSVPLEDTTLMSQRATTPYPESTGANRKKTQWPLFVLIGLICLIVLAIAENAGVLYYTAVAHPAEVNKVTQKLGTIHSQSTDIAEQLQTSNDFATATTDKLSLAEAQVKGNPASLYTLATAPKPTFSDALNDATTSHWSTSTNNAEGCSFQNNVYHATESQNNRFYICSNDLMPASGNFAFQTTISISGSDTSNTGGFLFRSQFDLGKFYYFDVSPDGYYNVDLFVDNNPDHIKTLQTGPIPQFKQGPDQPNQLAVIAIDTRIYIYSNKQYVASINDATYTSGDIDLLVSCGGQQTADVTFSDTKLWDLSH